MNFKPDQDDQATPAIDEALLDEALAEETPAELEAKILALTDPQMLSLLDEAMAPEIGQQSNEQLNDRILAATQQHMRPGSVPIKQPAHSGGVLARIGPSTFRYAAAAAIALAIGLGVYFVNQDPTDTDNTLVQTPDNTAVECSTSHASRSIRS